MLAAPAPDITRYGEIAAVKFKEFTIGASHTFNLGNFESMRFGASVTIEPECLLDCLAGSDPRRRSRIVGASIAIRPSANFFRKAGRLAIDCGRGVATDARSRACQGAQVAAVTAGPTDESSLRGPLSRQPGSICAVFEI